jgi:SAM-dependent methyltransferase
MDTSTYGRAWHKRYDALSGERDSPESIVSFVDRFATRRSVLELGVGTGRVALPLARAGYRVHGIDTSAEMLDLLRHKPDAELVTTTQGDIVDVDLAEKFGVVTCVFSSLCLLPDMDSQQRCVTAAARHLDEGGVLIVETFVLDPDRWRLGYSLDVHDWDGPDAALTVGKLDRSRQTIDTMRLDISGAAVTVLPNRLRYVYPTELDLMALRADLELIHRAESFADLPYLPDSNNQVAVYRRAKP